MGRGRRMKKQGPPAPLDESKITIYKKRKTGDAEPKVESGKKRRRTEVEEEEVVKEAQKKKKANGVIANGKEKKGAAVAEVKGKKKAAEKKPTFMESDDEDEDEDMSGLDEEELDQDEFDDLDGVSDGSMGSQIGDEFDLEEDEDDDSVVDSDDDDHPRQTMFSDDEDLSDAEEKLTAANIEGLSRKLDATRQAEEEEAERELQESALQTNIAGDRPDVFAGTEGEAQEGLAPDLQLLRTRITDTIRILGDMKTLGQSNKSRADYTQLLLNDICTYYGYTPFLAEKLFNLFTPMEAFAFFEANETPRPVVIRTNTLRTNRRSLAQALINRGVVLEPVGKWSKVGLQVFESTVPLGATPEYLAGHYILQAASSFLPVMALAPQENERVLDMASAPGGKTTYISALMRNTGCVIANDASKPRAKGLIGNIHRLGCKNTIVTHLDARTAFPKAMGGFDRVLLDAPCTGTGNERDFLAIPHMQRQLLLAAIDSVDHSSKTGGYIVYSTCSVTVEENEAVVQYVLRKRPNVKIVDTGLGDFGSPGFTNYMGKHFDAKMTMTRRYFPHRENVDGFFVCKLKKTGPTPAQKAADGAVGDSTATAGSKTSSRASSVATTTDDDDDDEVIDKTPITDEDGTVAGLGGSAFGPFDENEEEDAERILRAERNRLRRKGINPKSVLNKPKKPKTAPKTESTPTTTDDETPAAKETPEQPKEKKDESKKSSKSKPTKVSKSAKTEESSAPAPAPASVSVSVSVSPASKNSDKKKTKKQTSSRPGAGKGKKGI
ncbi:S-adenosylmethionine-dependent methyltransferase superfamily domain-containing protein [Aspergillus rambellii]|uniref:Nucleolar protein 2 n=1 Tax=Aspergillus rambellii TaxID=308745 RepID=A0A0F8UEG1_9EURO|nr:S-adenosylmethionine-dependent methyltransferase superfamily domain-containing protein [Aspergillus rambellii]